MAKGKRRRHVKQTSMWVATQDLPRSAVHPFYTRLNQIFDEHDFDGHAEGLCERFYAGEGRPGLPPGRYFRLLLIGYFEGLDAERAIAWRAADSFALREFLGLVMPDAPPDHSTISRTSSCRRCRRWGRARSLARRSAQREGEASVGSALSARTSEGFYSGQRQSRRSSIFRSSSPIVNAVASRLSRSKNAALGLGGGRKPSRAIAMA